MNGQIRAFFALAGSVVFLTGVAAAQTAKPAVKPPATTTARPSDEGKAPAPTKLVAPVRGVAELGYTTPVSKRDGKMIITKIKVKNLSSGPIAGLKVEEFWYNKDGDPVTGAQPFRSRKPLMPGEVIEIELQVLTQPGMDRNQYKFEHANGTIKATRLPKL